MSLKWGIIGCGSIAHKFAEDLALAGGNELYAVASRSIDKAKQFGEKHKAKKSYGSYEEICLNEEIDIIYLATPHSSHMQYGVMILNHGKHLLCEKPLGVNSKQVQKLINTAQKNQVFLMEALWSRFNPSVLEVLDLINKGEIGEVKYINADFYFKKEFDSMHRLFNPDLAGGALLDIGIYPLFLSYIILGIPLEITSKSRLHSNGVDLQTSVILEYENAQSILSFGLETKSDMLGCVHGELGSYQLHDKWHEAQGYTEIKGGNKISKDKPTLGYGYTYEIMECSKAISSGQLESELWSHQDSLNLIGMCDTIRNQNGIRYPFE